jgi:hypothetical protein
MVGPGAVGGVHGRIDLRKMTGSVRGTVEMDGKTTRHPQIAECQVSWR